jgi:sugar lactone lactonase YvrE
VVVAHCASRGLCRQPDGSLTTYAELSQVSDKSWNEIVVDGRGNTYVNGEVLALVTPDGTVRQVAANFAFPNGMAITPDNATLVLAEFHGKQLTAFDISTDGNLSHRRVWANLDGGVPDGICLEEWEQRLGRADYLL